VTAGRRATVEVSTDERGVTRLAMNRPDRHNALDRASIDALQAALDGLDGSTRVLVLAGRGGTFCAGADLDWMRASVDLTPAENTDDAMALSTLLESLDTLSVPTIARVHGAAIGGGAGLVACCDIAVAAERARFAFSEVRLGLIPATISPYVLRAIGPRAARMHFLAAERFDALEARRIELVHDVCPNDALDSRIETLIGALLRGGPDAQTASKRLIADVAGRPVDAALREDVADRLATTRAGGEAQEGLAAFFDKREARWRETI